MAIIKCKMCGGELNLIEGASTAACEYCGSVQTIPNLDDEKKLVQFERAERLRKQCEFDKAAGIYETIVADFRQEAEAYWGLVLCKYGIEYVDDPATGKKIPTCHRSSFDSIMEDSDFEQALENADPAARKVYREEAKAIEEIRKGIIAVSANEAPYDIFICYKETAEDGDRTLDSVLAQDVYNALTDKGYRVFFSRISLEDKLGIEYEPYIFAALNSAKIMLAFGTDYEYFNAVWVKNEWSRFLKLMAKDKEKHLIPCYKGIDAYDMPKEFARLQAQDLGKVGAVQDLLRGIEKLLPKSEPVKETIVVQQAASQSNPTVESYLKRAFMFLEDGDWGRADEFCEQVLNIDPESAQAYLGKLMAELKVKKQELLKDCAEPFDSKNNYQKALRFADSQLKADLSGYIDHIQTRNENARVDGIYTRAKSTMVAAKSESSYKEAARLFASICNHKDSTALAQECYKKAEIARKDAILAEGKAKMTGTSIFGYEAAIKKFQTISGWKDADDQVAACKKKIEEIKDKDNAQRKEAERIAKRKKKICIVAASVSCAIIAFIIVFNTVIIPNNRYNDAVALMDAGKYREAISAFEAMDGYKDSKDRIQQCHIAIQDIQYSDAIALMEAGKYSEAIDIFNALGGYKDTSDQILACEYAQALVFMDAKQYDDAILAFQSLGSYKGSAALMVECKYAQATSLKNKGKTAEAAIAFGAIADYQDAREQSFALWDKIAMRETVSGDKHTVGLKADGSVVAVGNNESGQCNVSSWKNIVAVSAGQTHTIGLKADGTVVSVGKNYYGQCNVSGWKNIVAVSASDYHTVGLKADGTVVAEGDNRDGQCNVSDWTDIVAISAGNDYTIGLKADGTMVAVGDNEYGQCNVSGWKDIVAVSAGSFHTVGLKADGTVVAVGWNEHSQCKVSSWKNIVAVSAGGSYTIGLRSNGTVVAVGSNKFGEINVSNWVQITAISTGGCITLGLRSNGTVVAVGHNEYGECDVSNWKNIKIPD